MGVIGIYHKDCIDGTTAAAVLLKRFPDARVFPLQHAHSREELQVVLDAAKPEDQIYTVDCGLGIREFLDKGHRVTTIDHHIGAKDLFASVEKEYEDYSFVFDNEKSGASLTWTHFFPDEDEPELIKYVEDGDLWKWKFGEDTKHINNYLSMFRNDPEAVLALLDGELSKIKEKGEVISRYADREIQDLILTPSIEVTIGDHKVPAYNITVYESACGNNLSEQLGSAVAMFTIKGDRVKFSFRSKDGQKPSALTLAHTLGGGGHELAAGADVSLRDFFKMVV